MRRRGCSVSRKRLTLIGRNLDQSKLNFWTFQPTAYSYVRRGGIKGRAILVHSEQDHTHRSGLVNLIDNYKYITKNMSLNVFQQITLEAWEYAFCWNISVLIYLLKCGQRVCVWDEISAAINHLVPSLTCHNFSFLPLRLSRIFIGLFRYDTFFCHSLNICSLSACFYICVYTHSFSAVQLMVSCFTIHLPALVHILWISQFSPQKWASWSRPWSLSVDL